MSAVGPYLLGIRSQGKEAQQEGTGILYSGGRYDRNLAASRLGILPFFIVAAITVYVSANRAFGPPVAVMAVLLFTSLPAVLAHAGLSTTDMALTGFLGAAFLSAHLWAEHPSLKRSAVFGVTAALATLSKLSFLAFFPVCAAVSLVCYFAIHRATFRPRLRALAANWFPYTRGLAVAAAIAALVVWAGYRFSFGNSQFVGARVPAPELFSGIQEVINHNKEGHATYLLGERSWSGFFLPVYIGFAIIAAGGLAYRLDVARKAAWAKTAAGLLTLWLVAGSAIEPEKVLADSDLDWGQDMKRLSRRLRELGAKEVTFAPFVWAEYEKEHGFPRMLPVDPTTPSPGWNVVSITVWKVARLGLLKSHPELTPWPDYIRVKPRERVGSSFLLWYFPPAQAPRGVPAAQHIPPGNE